MITILYILFFIVFSISAHEQEKFLEAHQAFDQHDLSKALMLFNQLEQKNATIWYNLGVCHYLKQDYMTAYCCFKQAHIICGNQQLYDLIDAAHDATLQKLMLPCQSAWYRTLLKSFWYINYIPVPLLQSLLLIVWWLFWLSLIYSVVKKRYITFIVVCCLTIILCTLFGGYYYLWQHNYAIIVRPSTPLYIGNNEQFEVKALLKSPQDVTIIKKEDGWTKIETKDGIGWVKDDVLYPIILR